jgi:hypothetical protein
MGVMALAAIKIVSIRFTALLPVEIMLGGAVMKPLTPILIA